MLEFVPPWRDVEGYIKLGVKEALEESELALGFLAQGLLRNAAGKAFQAWKALLAAYAAANRDLLTGRYPGVVKDRTGKTRSRADLIIAAMPTSRMREVAGLLVERLGWEVLYLTELALSLHEFQYNGLDREGAASRYTNPGDVKRDVERLVDKIKEWAGQLGA